MLFLSGKSEICATCHWQHYLWLFLDSMILVILVYQYICLPYFVIVMISCNGIYCYYQTKLLINYFFVGLKTRNLNFSKLVRMHQMHGQICRYYLIIYNEYWGIFLFGLFLIIIPFNVFCVLQTKYFNQMSIDCKSIILIGLFLSSGVLIFFPMALAHESKQLYEPKRYLVPIVGQLRKPYALRLKLKYDDWFNRFLTGRKYGPRISTIGPITYHTVLNVCFN